MLFIALAVSLLLFLLVAFQTACAAMNMHEALHGTELPSQFRRLTEQESRSRTESASRPYCLTAPLGSRDVVSHVTIW